MIGHIVIFLISVLGLTGIIHALLCNLFNSNRELSHANDNAPISFLLAATLLWGGIAFLWLMITGEKMPWSAVVVAFVGLLINSAMTTNLTYMSKKMSGTEQTALFFVLIGLLILRACN
jgi:hypothetical protein